MSPVNTDKIEKTMAYNPSKEDKELLLRVNERIQDLVNYRGGIKANPYDVTPKARTIEETWDYCDYVALPHKY